MIPYPDIPERTFDVTKWFNQTYKKSSDGRLAGYTFSHDEYLKIYQNATQIKTDSRGIRFIDENGEILTDIEHKTVDEFSYAGEWDSPKFSEIERELAWRIECNKIIYSYSH